MAEQLFFPGMSPLPKERPKNALRTPKDVGKDFLFLAIFPTPEALEKIDRFRQRFHENHRLKSKLRPASMLHATLQPIGLYRGVPEAVREKVSEAASEVAASIAPFDVRFSRVFSFDNHRRNRPFVLGDNQDNSELRELHHQLNNALGQAGLGYTLESLFTPHVTLIYDDQLFLERAVEPVQWTVEEIVLVHSLRGQTLYKDLGRWRLQGTAISA